MPSLVVSPSKDLIPQTLNGLIVDICAEALESRGVFAIALSGGSLPSFLATLNESFKAASVDPKFDCWHVILADERCVPSTDPDSNLGALNETLFSKISVPKSQIHGINEEAVSTEAVAQDYEAVVRYVLSKSGNQLDLAVLGFGPDGHTCSLFPGHALLQETTRLVAPIEDSPKPPSRRITLTLAVLNSMTRHVIFCGAGKSKSPILCKVFATVGGGKPCQKDATRYEVSYTTPPPYPCAMVQPQTEKSSVTWVVDADAVADISISD
jgi:6-phosphogluconolactonase